MPIDSQTLIADIAAAREGRPLRPGAKRKKIVYSDEIKSRVIRFARSSRLGPQAISRQLGLSPSAVRSWLGLDGDKPKFIPLTVTAAAQQPLPAPAPAPAPAAGDIVISWQTVTVRACGSIGREHRSALFQCECHADQSPISSATGPFGRRSPERTSSASR